MAVLHNEAYIYRTYMYMWICKCKYILYVTYIAKYVIESIRILRNIHAVFESELLMGFLLIFFGDLELLDRMRTNILKIGSF